MPTVVTITGCDVLFAHRPVDPEIVDPHVPDAPDVVTFDGPAWVSVLALENRGVGPGPIRLPRGPGRSIPQLNLRTCVTAGGRHGRATGVRASRSPCADAHDPP